MWRLLGILVASLMLVVAGTPALAQGNKDTARKHFREGHAAFKKGDFEAALTSFETAEEHFHAPPHLLFIARTKVKLGKLAEAYDVYKRLVDEELAPTAPGPFKRAQTEGRADLEKLEPQLGRIFVEVTGASDATITIDGRPVTDGSVVVDPGKYEVVASADGYDPATESVEVTPGAPTRVTMKLTVVLPKEPPKPQAPIADADDGELDLMEILPWAVIGLGAAGLAVGAITGGMAAGKVSDIRDQCPNNPCSPALADDKDSATSLATASTVSFIVGGIIAAGGISWLLVNVTTAEDEVGGQVTIRGTF